MCINGNFSLWIKHIFADLFSSPLSKVNNDSENYDDKVLDDDDDDGGENQESDSPSNEGEVSSQIPAPPAEDSD